MVHLILPVRGFFKSAWDILRSLWDAFWCIMEIIIFGTLFSIVRAADWIVGKFTGYEYET